MAYTHVQPIGYSIGTFPVSDTSSAFKQKYLGIDDDDRDVTTRCKIMSGVIGDVADDSAVDTSSTTLKIFMAPEFYFRGSKGAYPLERVAWIMGAMRDLTEDGRFDHWLFVFGTAVGYIDSDSDNREILNVVMVQRGGVSTGEVSVANTLIVYKEYISHIDFIRDRASYPKWDNEGHRMGLIGSSESGLIPIRGSRDLRSKEVIDKEDRTVSGLGGQSIFEMDGITFGLEVCLYHYKKRLRTANNASKDGQKYVQIHLIPSAGASIQKDAIGCIGGGVIFNVDGGKPHSSVKLNDGSRLFPSCSSEVGVSGEVDSWTSFVPYRDECFSDQGKVAVHEKQKIPKAMTAW